MSESAQRIHDDTPQTLGQLHLQAERSVKRRAVVRWADGGQWREMPGWRFHRQVIRVGLFLRERLGITNGDRVLVVSPLRVERVVAEWATVALGAIAVTLDGEQPDDALSAVCSELAPKAAFAVGPANRLLRVRGAPAPDAVIVFDPDPAPGVGRSWPTVLDLGGTLDTAERAQSFRAAARSLTPSMAAIGYRERENGAPTTLLTHAEIVARLRGFWRRMPPRDGDLAYIAARGSAPVCLPMWAFVADGRTSTAFGNGGREGDEITELRPHLVVGPPDLGGRIRAKAWRNSKERAAFRLLERVPIVAALRDRLATPGDSAAPGDWVREIMTFDGTRIGDEKRGSK
jgi:hypothetical protein